MTLVGLDVTGALVGERWEIDGAVFEVAQPRMPCWKLGARMNAPAFPDVFLLARRPSAYLRIVQEGEVGAGDEVRVVYRPAHMLTVRSVVDIYDLERGRAPELLEVAELAEVMKAWARRRLRYSTK